MAAASCAAGLAFGPLSFGAARAAAPDAAALHIDPKAAGLVAAMSAAYSNLNTFSEVIHFRAQSTQQVGQAPEGTTTVYYRKPDHLNAVMKIQQATTSVVEDGAHLYVIGSLDKTLYFKLPAPTDKTLTMAAAAKVGHINLGLLPYLFGSTDPLEPLRKAITALSTGGTAEADGVTVDVLNGTVSPAPGVDGKLTLEIGKDDHLLRSVTIEIVSPVAAASTVTELHTMVKANPGIPSSMFNFSPPAGAVPVTSLRVPPYDPHLVPGATPTSFTGTDANGKPISLGEFAGDVTLVYFWAVSDQSAKDIPSVVAAYKKYHARGFQVLGVALDNYSDPLRVREFAKANGMTWRQLVDPAGWDGVVAGQYRVKAVPFSMLLGKDGKIVAVNPRGAQLEQAISQALKR